MTDIPMARVTIAEIDRLKTINAELLEAIEAAVKDLERYGINGPALEKARAAISKAREK